MVEEWIRKSVVEVEVLPAAPGMRDAALLATQVTTRSPLGAIAHQAAGLLIDHGWLRVLGAGGHPRFSRSLPGWNLGKSDGFFLVADDVVGGSFAINGGGLGGDSGHIHYYAPDSLHWETLGFGYSQFLAWAMSANLKQFYTSFRWPKWQEEVGKITADQSINFYPPLFAKGETLKKRSRRAIPAEEQYAVQLDIQRQLGGR